MTFFGINQNAIYKGKKDNAELILPENTESQMVKTMRAGLTEKQIVELNNMILKYLATQKPYLNPDYSLQMMADDLKVSRQKLSEVINQGQKKNFYKLINELRVTDVKEMLNDQKYSNYTVLGIGLECGFNSKTSFNRIFKEETGLTPSEYRKTV
jgi:AraC-like DNA-binding protein